MNKKIDELLYDFLKPANEPEPELNRRILKRRSDNMRKWNVKKVVVAAAISCVVVVGSISAYAATQNFSVLSLFDKESKEVKKNASQLLDKKVEQTQEPNTEQLQWATFKIREAICDKNKVIVQVAVKAVNPEKYLLVPQDFEPELDIVDNLCIDGVTGKQTIAEYAKSLGKECLKVGAGISGTDAPEQSIEHYTEKDGTLLYNIAFNNEKKNKKLDYVCETSVYPTGENADIDVKNKINFTLTDKTNMEVIKYLPVSNGKVAGTNLVVDVVTFEKSDLEMICKVKYHYAGKEENWEGTKDYDICFFPLDSKGKIIESSEGGSTNLSDKKTVVQSWIYSLQELPDSITFQAKDVMEKNVYGTVDVKLAK